MTEYFKAPEEKKIASTENYKVFSEEIDCLINFFDCFSELLFDTSFIDCSVQALNNKASSGSQTIFTRE